MANKPETLVILTPAFPGSEEETVWVPPKQVFVKALNRNFPALKIVILSFYFPKNKPVEYGWHGNRVIPLQANMLGKVNQVVLLLRVWAKLWQIKRTCKITGILSFWCGICALAGRYFSFVFGLKHFIWISGQDAKKNNKLVKLIRPPASSLVAMSDFLVREFYKSHGIKPAFVIPPGTDAGMFPAGVSYRDIDIMGAGSLIPLKQYNLFIEVVKQLVTGFPAVKCVICGGGPEKEQLQNMIEGAGLRGNITLYGAVPHTEVLKYMQRSKVFLHTSEYEGFGVVNLEALYAGAQVISFVKPMDEAIRHWHIAASPREMAEMATAILSNPQAEHSPVLPYPVDASAKLMMGLFYGGNGV